jgi:DNA-binding FadR family transcriptional regulator
MTDHPNYRALSPPDEKARPEYTYTERRAELYDLIEQAGHYRNLERSIRDLGNRYGVSHTTIRNDIEAIHEWKADHLGQHATAELQTLKTRAIQDALDRGDSEEAYYLMRKHFETLMDHGAVASAAEEHEHTHDATEAYAALVGAASETASEEVPDDDE